MLLVVYGLRRKEVVNLRIEDLDWEHEVIYIRRAKGAKAQIFPLSKTVGDDILNYLKKARPKYCSHREVFLNIKIPNEPLTAESVTAIVAKYLKPMNLSLKHHGPHALRHACATHLMQENISLKSISEHLGHQSLEATRIYAKVDINGLRKVADFNLGGVL